MFYNIEKNSKKVAIMLCNTNKIAIFVVQERTIILTIKITDMKTVINFTNLYELSRFVKNFVFEGGKDFTFSKFNDLQISMNFAQIQMESELTGSELETLLTGKKIKYNYVQQF